MTRFWWVLGFVLVGLAFYICLVPNHDIPQGLEINDKLSHALGHAAMALYFSGLVARRRWWVIFLALFGFGVAVEFLQHSMNMGREGDLRDVIANSVGDLLGLLLGYLGLARWPQWIGHILGGRKAT